jgi:hypothetical protein
VFKRFVAQGEVSTRAPVGGLLCRLVAEWQFGEIACSGRSVESKVAIAMIKRALVGLTLLAFAGASIFKIHQELALRCELQMVEKQNASMAEQIRTVQLERDQASNRVASLAGEIDRLTRDSTELLRLRSEVTRLRSEMQDSKHPIERQPTVSSPQPEKSEVGRLNLITQWLQQHPSEKSPELKLLSAQDWLSAAEGSLDNEVDYPFAMSKLRMAAEVKGVLPVLQAGLKEYALANSGQFPQNVGELRQYLNPPFEEELLQRYEIQPVSGLLAAVGPSDVGLGSDLVITEKSPVNEASDARMMVGMSNFVFSLQTNRWVTR